MRTFTGRATAAALLSAASVAGVVLAPGTAEAASYNSACGSGYREIDHLTLNGYGTVFLTYSSATGKNCVVTVRNQPGAALYMNALVRLAGSANWIGDYGDYTTYAGPVYVSAAGRCIDWGGEIETAYEYRLDVHCG
ncbi:MULTISPECIES: spore-associated protein A [unclassified Kitasatospora]|uniref:spore-associated protein A n=1 Tax=unclassified Kitasatospora TaxID=2633591 RepID=UPI00381AAC66